MADQIKIVGRVARPIRHDKYVRLDVRRIPPDGPLNPRLQRATFPNAIGFTARLTREDDTEE